MAKPGTISYNDIINLVTADCADPHSILGMHLYKGKTAKSDAIVIRSFFPNASSVHVIDIGQNKRKKMTKIHEGGLFESKFTGRTDFFAYKYDVKDASGCSFTTYDPYCFLPQVSDYDTYLFNQGNHHKIYEKLGCHLKTVNGVSGAVFSVWAPNARRVSVVGNFNQWDGRRHQMRCLGSSGIWEIFIPGICIGDLYKYEIKTRTGEILLKADPYAFFTEQYPGSASIVADLDCYKWNDQEWIEKRSSSNPLEQPVSIYEVHAGSWTRDPDNPDRLLTYRELADKLVKYVLEMGYTHIEFLPLAEHPYYGSWGYQATGYYSITSRYGRPEDFMYLVDTCHRNGIGVIVDWVPAHFPKDTHGLANFDGTALYEHWNPKQAEHPHWGTLIFNYGRHEVRNFLVSNAVFWFDKYHVDGLRVDAVASMLYLDYGRKPGQWVPNKWGGNENVCAIDFLRQLNSTVYKYFPGVMMIAEESTSWPMVTKPPYTGGLGFLFKWNMGWMNDFLSYMSMDSVYRKYHHNKITFSLMYAMSENFMLVLSHDEVVHGKRSMIEKMPGDYWQKFAGLRASYGYMYGHPGKKLLFMGNDFGQFSEWSHTRSLDWHLLDYDMHRKLQLFVKDLNRLYTSHKALYEIDYSYDGFEWIDCNDNIHSMVSFIRKGRDYHDMLIFVCNFTPVVHEDYRLGVPFEGYYKEVLNSDSEIYGGSNVGNLGGLWAENQEAHGRPYSIRMRIPPLSVVVLEPVFSGETETGKPEEAEEACKDGGNTKKQETKRFQD